MYCTAEVITGRLGLSDSMANTHSVLAGVKRQRNVELSHHLLHYCITLGMDDKISFLVFRCFLQVDDDKLASCRSSTLS